MQHNTTIFIDECQSLSTRAQHILLTAISEKKLYIPRGVSTKSKREIPLANFVLILASTHEFQLQDGQIDTTISLIFSTPFFHLTTFSHCSIIKKTQNQKTKRQVMK